MPAIVHALVAATAAAIAHATRILLSFSGRYTRLRVPGETGTAFLSAGAHDTQGHFSRLSRMCFFLSSFSEPVVVVVGCRVDVYRPAVVYCAASTSRFPLFPLTPSPALCQAFPFPDPLMHLQMAQLATARGQLGQRN